MDKLIKECVYCQGKEPELTPYAYIPVCERHLKNPEHETSTIDENCACGNTKLEEMDVCKDCK